MGRHLNEPKYVNKAYDRFQSKTIDRRVGSIDEQLVESVEKEQRDENVVQIMDGVSIMSFNLRFVPFGVGHREVGERVFARELGCFEDLPESDKDIDDLEIDE